MSDDREKGSESRDGDPTKAPAFQRVLKNLINTPHKPQAEMKAPRKRLPKATRQVER
jgi:hypothetical protein